MGKEGREGEKVKRESEGKRGDHKRRERGKRGDDEKRESRARGDDERGEKRASAGVIDDRDPDTPRRNEPLALRLSFPDQKKKKKKRKT